MGDNILSILYAVYGIVVGALAASIYGAESVVGWILFILIGAIISFSIKEEYIINQRVCIIVLVLAILLICPIAYVYQYMMACMAFCIEIFKWIFKLMF